jgi:hypothetical protein
MGLLNLLSNPMKRVFSLLAPTATVTAILISGITPAQSQELVQTSMFNTVVAQGFPKNSNQQFQSSPPPVDGRPDERTGAGTQAAQPPVELLEEPL